MSRGLDTSNALCELAHKQGDGEVDAYGECRDIDGHEVTGEGGHGSYKMAKRTEMSAWLE